MSDKSEEVSMRSVEADKNKELSERWAWWIEDLSFKAPEQMASRVWDMIEDYQEMLND